MTGILKRSAHMSPSRVFVALAIAAFMAMMLSDPDYYLNSARRGLSLYATSVLPSLFPFYFCSLLLTFIGAARTVSTIFQKPIKLLYNAPKESAYVLILSMLSGYPVGASMTAELYSAGVFDSADAKTVCSFASTSGPIFMLGTVGSAIFGDVRIGAIILSAHYIAALINGFIYKKRSKKRKKTAFFGGFFGKNRTKNNDFSASKSDLTHPAKVMTTDEVDSLMSRTIAASTLNMLYVGGYIVLCGMLVDTVSLLRIDSLMAAAFGERVAQPLLAALYGLIEMTRGCIASAECGKLGVAIAAGVISFGGLSVTLQNYTFLSKCHIKFHEVILRKFTQAVIAFALALLISIPMKMPV